VQQAAELSVAAPTIEAALDGRFLSGLKEQRVAAAKYYEKLGLPPPKTLEVLPCNSECKCAALCTSSLLHRALCCMSTQCPAPDCTKRVVLQRVSRVVQGVDKQQLVEDVAKTLYAAKICSYAQGMNIIKAKSAVKEWDIDLGALARIWKVDQLFVFASDVLMLLLVRRLGPRYASVHLSTTYCMSSVGGCRVAASSGLYSWTRSSRRTSATPRSKTC
jgi:6-phosphogluconate dehydrogenase